MIRTVAILLALLTGATASKCKVPKFHDFYAVSGTGRYTADSDSTTADFPEFVQGSIGVNGKAEDKFGGQDAGFFNMVRYFDLNLDSDFFGKYACMITKTAEQALCTSLDMGNEEGPVVQMDLHLDDECNVEAYDSYTRDLAGPDSESIYTLIAHGIPKISKEGMVSDISMIEHRVEAIQSYLQGKGLTNKYELVLVGDKESAVDDFACDCTCLHDGVGRDFAQSDFLHLKKGEPVYDKMPQNLQKDVDAVNAFVGRPDLIWNLKDTDYELAEECNWLGYHGLGLLSVNGVASDLNACNYGLIVWKGDAIYMDPENKKRGLRVYASSVGISGATSSNALSDFIGWILS